MRKCKNVYVCFIGAVFMLSLYNFVSLSVLEGLPPPMPHSHGSSEDGDLPRPRPPDPPQSREIEAEEDGFQLEFEDANPHVFERSGVNLGEDNLEEVGSWGAELEASELRDAGASALFWPAAVELALPDGVAGPGMDSCRQFRAKIGEQGVNRTEGGSWRACGRPQNAHAVLGDGTELCVRHRKPHDYFVLGDVLSFHLSQLLELLNVPCVVLDTVDAGVRWGNPDLDALKWAQGDLVALIQWVPATASIPLPKMVVDALIEGRTLGYERFEHESMDTQIELAQWSDIVIFDFLTGQYDRIASMQDEADKQNDTSLLRDKIRNMAQDGDGNLWVFDNEAGLLDAYILMYQEVSSKNHLRFQTFHHDMLNTFCVFRRGTVLAVSQLYQSPDPVDTLLDLAREAEPLISRFHLSSEPRMAFLRAHFKDRLAQLIAHFKHCADTLAP